MTANEYQEACCKLENKDSEAIRNRLLNPSMLMHLADALEALMAASTAIDKVKKSAYYGKDMGLLDRESCFDNSNIAKRLYGERPIRLIHAVLGLGGECGELAEKLYKTIFDGDDYTVDSWIKEFGDFSWYNAVGCSALNVSFEESLIMNIEKLKKRYPNLFEEKRAQTHDGN